MNSSQSATNEKAPAEDFQILEQQAQRAVSECKFVLAIEMYFTYFDSLSNDEYSESSEEDFTSLLCNFGHYFSTKTPTEELLKCYIRAVNHFPKNAALLNALGGYLFQCGEFKIGKKYVQDALRCDEKLLIAEKNLLHIKWNQLPRWHFRMLNDSRRNNAYKTAINKAIDKGFNKIVDIGSGCGLLSLYAGSRQPKPEIMAFEENELLFEMGLRIFEDHNVHVLPMNVYSTNVSMGPIPKNLLITEIFDVSLFGEGILTSLVHAFSTFMPDGLVKVIPAKARIYLTGISCNEIVSKFKFTNFIPELRLDNICLSELKSEPYEAEHLNWKRVKYVTDTVSVMTVDFMNKDLLELLKQDLWEEIINLTCIEAGEVHALAVWFDLHLDDDTVITTNPLDEKRVFCWEQAIFNLNHPFKVNTGDQVQVAASLKNECFEFEVTQPVSHECKECFHASKDLILYLNDKDLVDCLIKVARTFTNPHKVMIDYSPCPVLGLLLAKKGHRVYHMYKNEADVEFLQHVLMKNSIHDANFTFVSASMHVDYIPTLKSIDIVFFEAIDPDGSLKQLPLHCALYNKWKPLALPKHVRVGFCLIDSPYLEFCNRVDDQNVAPFQIGKYINEYTGTEHPALENFPHKVLSNDHYWKFLREGHAVFKIDITKAGLFNGILTWYLVDIKDRFYYSTQDSSYYLKTCYLVESPLAVSVGDIVEVAGDCKAFSVKMSHVPNT